MQIVGYEAGTPDEAAALRLATDGTVTTHRLLPGERLDFGLGQRHCAGRIDDTSHEPCENSKAPYCDVHTIRWPCAQCRGDCAMPIEACHEEHAIYLAAFEPDQFKVGVTRQWRLQTRLTEQGARRAAHIRTVDNGRRARQIEAEIANDVPDRITTDTKISGLGQPLDLDAWEQFLGPYGVIEMFDFDYGLELEVQPIPTTMATGRIHGSSGRILVLEEGETTYAIDLRALIGYEISDGGSDPDRQTSLGAF
ncbi:MAG: DUF2797 domain-containing protein [Halodesulfurarchaeum sp.]|nr:DUF2797 domain-containing protein [Halodesulfurarchaeum sp.]